MKSFQENTIGWLLYGGALVFVICGMGTWFAAVGFSVNASASLGNGIVILGGIMTVGGFFAAIAGLAMGLLGVRTQHQGPARIVSDAVVIARYAADRNGILHTDDFSIQQLDGLTFCVRLDLHDGDNAEYECSEPVFWQCGEGMTGEAMVQGRWLNRFVPLMGQGAGRKDLLDI